MPEEKTITTEEFFRGGTAIGDRPTVLSANEFFGDQKPKVVQPTDVNERLSFSQRFGEDLQERKQMAEEIRNAYQTDEQPLLESVFQVIGKVGFGAALDLIGEGVTSAFRGISKVTPDIIEKPAIDATKAAGLFFLDTTLGRQGLEAVEGGVDSWGNFKQEHPRAARNIEAVLDIGILVAPVKGKPKLTPPTRIGRVGEELAETAVEQRVVTQQSFLETLVRPKQTQAVLQTQVPRTTERGIFKTKVIEASPEEKLMAEAISKVEGLSSSKTIQGNFTLIDKHNISLAKKLEADIAKNDFVYPKRELLSALKDTKTAVLNNPVLVGDVGKSAEKWIDAFMGFVDKSKGTGSGLLKARKDFDKWVKTQKPKILDPNTENALSLSLREVRQTANNFLNKHAKDVDVKASLKEQSTLFRALDNIVPKAAEEGANVLIRAWQRSLSVLGAKNSLIQVLAGAAGLGGLGAAAVFAPFVRNLLLGTGLIIGTRRVIKSAGTKDFFSKVLKAVDASIRKTKDANLIKELRVDRALIVELLEEEPEED